MSTDQYIVQNLNIYFSFYHVMSLIVRKTTNIPMVMKSTLGFPYSETLLKHPSPSTAASSPK